MIRPRAFYAVTGSKWGDLRTLLHPPYTLWHLSYVAIGAGLAPELDPIRLSGTLLAFLLGLGVGAHALDEVTGRPLQTGLSDRALWALGIGGLFAGGTVGVIGAFVISPLTLLWSAVGMSLAAAYSLEWSRLVHSDWGFALAWGAFPTLVGYWAQVESLTVAAVVAAGAAALISRAQRALSTPARRLRRSGADLDQDWLVTLERPLRLLSGAMPLLAAALLLAGG